MANMPVLKSIFVNLLFIGTGLIMNVMAPTLATMEYLLQTDTKTISYAFTGNNLGLLTGAVLCGSTFERFNKELLLGIFAIVEAVAIASAPWTGNLYSFIGLIFFAGIGNGFSVSGGTAYTMALWGNHWIRRPLQQTLHLMWSIGATFSPFIAKAFLIPLEQHSGNITGNYSDLEEDKASLQQELNTTLSSVQTENKDIAIVNFAYVSAGALSLLPGFAFMILFALDGCNLVSPKNDPESKTENIPEDKSTGSDYFRVKMLALMCLFYFLYLGYESPMRALLSMFAIKYLRWDLGKGALLTSAFWGAMVLGRLINAPVSAIFSPKTMLIFNFIGTISAFVLFVFVKYHEVLVWLSISLAGYSMSSTFSTGVLWASQYVQVNGVASSVFLIGSSISSMSFTPFVGFLFQTFSPMWLVYTVLASSICHCVLCLGIYIYARHHIKILAKTEVLHGEASMKTLNEGNILPRIS